MADPDQVRDAPAQGRMSPAMIIADILKDIFKGNTDGSFSAGGCFSTYTSEKPGEGGKSAADFVFHHSSPGFKEFLDHVEGRACLAVVPEKRVHGRYSDHSNNSINECYWGTVECDDYATVDFKAIHKACVKLAIPCVPLADHLKWLQPNPIITRTKSGGARLWLFAPKGVDVCYMRRCLEAIAEALGWQGAKNIWPTRDESDPMDESHGNTVNLPFFGHGMQPADHLPSRGQCYLTSTDGEPIHDWGAVYDQLDPRRWEYVDARWLID